MKKSATGLIVCAGLLLSACASQTGWTPTIDTYDDPKAYRIDQDLAECRQLAERAAGGVVRESATGAAVGGAVGAAGGAVLGAITGSPGTGAALGAAVGGFGGGVEKGLSAEEHYKNAYNNCMSNRGHRVVR